jgi:asparagine synthase (glutamine-hydrolysing)
MVEKTHSPGRYTLSRQDSSLGQFACMNLGLFDHSVSSSSRDGSVGVILDGWIWSFPSGETNDGPDGEVDAVTKCLEGYLREGIDFVRGLNGEFTMAVWDERDGSVWLVNDRYGLRPLQYCHDGDELFFAPEGKAILAATGKAPRLDMTMLMQYLAISRAFQGSRTFFRGITLLPPASILRWRSGTVTRERYWDYLYRPLPSIGDDFIEEMGAKFVRAVRRRAGKRYRHAVALSGGLDSRLVAGGLVEVGDKPPVALTFGIPDSDEVTLARRVADRLGIPWHFMELGPSDFIEQAPQAVRISEGLDLCVQGYGLSVFPKLAEMADVCFTGLLIGSLLSGRHMDAALLSPEMGGEEAFSLIRRREVSYFSDEILERMFVSGNIASRSEAILRKMWEPEAMQTNWADHAERFFLQHRGLVVITRQVWQRLFLEDASPSFDNDFIDMILQIPARERLNHKTYRRFINRLLPDLADIPYQRTLLPTSSPLEFWEEGSRIESLREALYRNISCATGGDVHIPYKRYSTNYDEWLRLDKDWARFTDELLLSPSARFSDAGIDGETVREMVLDHRAGKGNYRQGILQLMTLELFLREFFS